MATLLLKPVKRKSLDGIIITVHPTGIISFRKPRKRTEYKVTFKRAFQMAVFETLDNEYNNKLKKYTDRKKLGLRTKRPTKPSYQMFAKKIQMIYSLK
jgi:hypothetical protein